MSDPSIVESLFLVFTAVAVIATVALYSRQALLIAYIGAGVLLGPSALDWVANPELLEEMSSVGILFLLFLLGLNLEPAELKSLLSEAVWVTTISSVVFFIIGFVTAKVFGFDNTDGVLIGIAMMFSSTIVALKLLPTSALHHLRMGEIIVSILLLQDILAITIIIFLTAFGDSNNIVSESIFLIVGLPLLSLASWWVASRYLVIFYRRFDQIHEYLFLLAIAWCLGIAELGSLIGLSHEVGAFIAGVTMATSPIARFIAESLKPIRDFFLVLFFFALGASLDLSAVMQTWMPAIVLAVAAVFVKPLVFKLLFQKYNEKATLAHETGARLGQISEFSLLILAVATQLAIISSKASALIQSATILSFALSSFWIVKRYPTPMAVDSALRRD